QTRCLEHRGHLDRGELLAVRPAAVARHLQSPEPVPRTAPVGYQREYVATASAGHAAHEPDLVVEAEVLQHAGVEHQVELRFADRGRIAQDELAGEPRLCEPGTGVAQSFRREVLQGHLVTPRARESEALPSVPGAGFEHA